MPVGVSTPDWLEVPPVEEEVRPRSSNLLSLTTAVATEMVEAEEEVQTLLKEQSGEADATRKYISICSSTGGAAIDTAKEWTLSNANCLKYTFVETCALRCN